MILKHLTDRKQKATNFAQRSAKLVDFKNLQKLSKELKSQNKKIVFTTGSFDLLNPGHCRYLAEAKAQGDILVVGVSTDSAISQRRGPNFPLINENIRAELLSHLKTVDYITIVDEHRPHAILFLLQPDIFFTSQRSWDKGDRDAQEKYIIDTYGGKIVIRDVEKPYMGTSFLVEHIANIKVMQILEGYIRERIESFYLDSQRFLKPADYGEQKPNDLKAFNSNSVIVKFEDLKKLGNKLRKSKEKIVFVSGSYDLLHAGHARFIEQAALLGDVLIAGIPSDKSLRGLKGIGRPIISQNSRAYVLGHLDTVDYVTIFDSYSVYNTLKELKPDVFFTVDESWNNGYKQSPEYKLVKGYGGEIVRAKRQSPFLSSSAIIAKLARRKVKEIFKECMDDERIEKLALESSRLK